MKVAIFFGSKSDTETMKKASSVLADFGVDYRAFILSAQADIQNSKTIYLPISKKQLADHLGVQRPSLFRELKNMKDEGLIEINNRIITLLI